MTLINGGAPFLMSAARDLGLTRVGLRGALHSGAVRRVFNGVAVDGAAPDTRDLRLDALALIIPADVTVALHTAAAIWGAETRPPSMLRDLRPTVMTRHGGTRLAPSRAISYQSTVPDHEAVELRGVRITSPVRTIVDVMRRLWRPHALAGGDAMVAAGVVDLLVAREAIASWRSLTGIRQAKDLAPALDPEAETHGESWMRCRLLDAGFPRPTLQFPATLRDGRKRRLDAAWPAQLTAAEYDGRTDHRGSVATTRDEVRREELSEQRYWHFGIATFENVFGADETFERELAAHMGVPVRPRWW